MLAPDNRAKASAAAVSTADGSPAFRFVNSYAALPTKYYTRCLPAPTAGAALIKFNEELAVELGVETDGLDAAVLAQVFSGNLIPAGADPIAMVYAGHQFGQFVPQLGDGRAILLGEILDPIGVRRDIQLKGAGRTPYSRGGDGRAALGPVLREYVVSEAMSALGIPTTRSLAAVTTGEVVYREGALPGAIVTRVAASHVRVGTFQYFAARGDLDGVKVLADYVIDRHYAELKGAANPYAELLRQVTARQCSLIARWMQVGFIHGVMNTDNMTVSGETIDFGPCAFMDTYNPAQVFSSIDRMGRYAYANQPAAAQWDLARFAETLLPLIDAERDRAVEKATEIIDGFSVLFEERWLSGMRAKIGLVSSEPGDAELVSDWLGLLGSSEADFTVSFRRLCEAAASLGVPASCALFPAEYQAWIGRWKSRLALEPQEPRERAAAMRAVNPAFIPRNHRVEEMILAAVEGTDFSAFERLLQVLRKPFDDQPGLEAYATPPRPEQRVLQTFCGT